MSDQQYQRSPSYGQVLDRLRENTKRVIRVAMPCIVQAYDPTTQTVDVQPAIADQLQQEDGTFAAVPFAVIPHVPVAFPSGGGMRLTFPLAKGDTGMIVMADLSIDLWQQQGGQVVPPAVNDPVAKLAGLTAVQRRHDLSDALFVPGLHPDNASWTGASTTGITLGADAGPQAVFRQAFIELGGNDGSPPTDFVALASLVLARLNAIKSAFDGHVHAAGTLLAPNGAVTGSTAGAAAMPAMSSVASAKVKAQ